MSLTLHTIVSLLKIGASVNDIAKAYIVPHYTVVKTVRNAGASIREIRKNVTAMQLKPDEHGLRNYFPPMKTTYTALREMASSLRQALDTEPRRLDPYHVVVLTVLARKIRQMYERYCMHSTRYRYLGMAYREILLSSQALEKLLGYGRLNDGERKLLETLYQALLAVHSRHYQVKLLMLSSAE